MYASVLHGVDQPYLYEEVAQPVPAAGELLIRLSYAALNHRDVWIQKGQYAGLKFPVICGSDGCGTVVAAGDGADASRVGETVVVNPSLNWGDNPQVQAKDYVILGLPHDGTFAQYVCVSERLVHKKPEHLSMKEAAALPLAGLTAFRATATRAAVKARDTVLVNGIGGGVALFAAQFAQALGASVFVTSGSEEKLEAAKKLGFEGGVNYRSADWHKTLQKMSGGFDAIIDSAGGNDFAKLIDLAKPAGRIAIYGATNGSLGTGVAAKIFWKQLSILGSTMGNDAEFASMLDLVNRMKIVPQVAATFALQDAEAAMRFMEEGRQFGKIVLEIPQ